ncbi:hypothetical protein V1634_25850 [Plantactinospora veratri]|uniref:Uncharacterized protein n=1 Tax=Plantactinospora veratri TaxID=1436122 RepID=A0ABU7SK10_9ACTN
MSYPVPSRPTRAFFVDDILQGRVNLDAYPLRYIRLGFPGNSTARAMYGTTPAIVELLDRMFSAVELLESRGWELVLLEEGGLWAFLRRRYQPAH